MQCVILIFDDDLLVVFDVFSVCCGYYNCLEVVCDILCDVFNQDFLLLELWCGYVVLLYVYEYEKCELVSWLVVIQYYYYDFFVVMLYVYISYDDCLEIVVLKGDMVEVQYFVDDVIVQCGVCYGYLQCLVDD